jgi:transitional endoplasmic reticulum ATPase
MNEDTIQTLTEAIKLSPGNIPLRLLLADTLQKNERYEEAAEHFKFVLDVEEGNVQAKAGISKVYFNQKKYSAAIVVLESLVESEDANPELLILLSKSLVRNNEPAKAREYYEKSLALNPALTDEELDSELRATSTTSAAVHDMIESLEQSMKMEKPRINFDQVGGMQKVKEDIKIKIIQPLLHPELYRAYGKKIGGGILLYGPPGCGKTHLARATAGQINSNFISIGIHDVLDMWQGNSEKKLHEIFELARRQTPCVLFFDEIDALGANRSDMRQSSAKMLINQFLNELDGVEHSNEGLLILGATNAPWHLDPAFRRPGRFDQIIFVNPPEADGRESILKILLKNKPLGDIDYTSIAKVTDGFSGADLMAIVDRTIEEKLRSSFESGTPQPIQTKDLIKFAKVIKPSTKEWFGSARNYALYSNESGIYDDILEYLKIKK